MKTAVIFNSDLHFEHKLWKRELFFWEDEMKSFEKRLVELVDKWTDKSMLANLEHFQNQFTIQKQQINELQNAIETHEISIALALKDRKDVLDLKLVKNHIECRNKMETQREIYSNLKKEFFRFLTEYM